MLGAGERAQAEGWVARCAERAMRAEEGARSNHAVARDLGLPLMRALLASERGEPTRRCAGCTSCTSRPRAWAAATCGATWWRRR